VIDDIGVPQDPIDFTFGFTPNVGPFDGEVLVSLKEKHSATENYVEALRKVLPKEFPAMTFYFKPVDMVTQILDFGVTAPIDVQVQGTDPNNFEIAREVVIPSTALVIYKNGMHVVTVSADSRVHFVPVDIGQDMGAQVEISQGLHGGETLVSNPSDLLSDGQKVSIAQ
jgi:hypothetical protein